jgi:hypothetical protein
MADRVIVTASVPVAMMLTRKAGTCVLTEINGENIRSAAAFRMRCCTPAAKPLAQRLCDKPEAVCSLERQKPGLGVRRYCETLAPRRRHPWM